MRPLAVLLALALLLPACGGHRAAETTADTPATSTTAANEQPVTGGQPLAPEPPEDQEQPAQVASGEGAPVEKHREAPASSPATTGRQQPSRPLGAPAAPPPPARVPGARADRAAGSMPQAAPTMEYQALTTENYAPIEENAFLRVSDDPRSTFSVDVDTASYSNVRRFLAQGSLPPAGAVRIEEMLNYFPYDYPQPQGDEPFSVTTEAAACPWNSEHRLALVGLQGRKTDEGDLPRKNLVFLIDVSGSMSDPDKLPLVQAGLRHLADGLRENDRVAIVVYAGSSGLVLPPTADRAAVREALERLEAGGSTNGGEGIRLAYEVAGRNFDPKGVNRVILCTDGDFNVGVTSDDELIRLIEKKRKTGVFLTVLGFGTGNLKDSRMEQLADKGNGNYAYIDSEREARKALVEQAGGTLVTIAKDVKLQVEFNPAEVAEYRLIGYENRVLAHQDFKDDGKDAGDLGSGHCVTALYEIVPASRAGAPGVDPLKYQEAGRPSSAALSGEMLTVKLRYKQPDGDRSREIARTLKDRGASLERASENLRFASAVASFGMLLRGSEHKANLSYEAVLRQAREARGQDPRGYRAEFLQMVEQARRLSRA